MKASIFNKAFSSINFVIPFSDDWFNGTGYLDHAVRLVKLGPDVRAVSTTPAGRKIILIGTKLGTIVVFERYNDNNDKENIVVTTNTPRDIERVVECGALTDDGFLAIIERDWSLFQE